MLNGDQRILCEKQQYMSDWRQSVPSAKYFFRHAPNNVYVTELEGSAQEFCGWQAAVAYVLPFESPATRMDSESAERFLDLLRAKDRDALQTASSRLGLIRREDDPVLPGELSIARLRTVLTGFCACFRLRKRYKGFRYLGTCRIFCRMGTCPHELCARFLDGDKEVSMACLSEWTQAQEPESIIAADAQPIAQLRTEREHIPPLPPAAAMCTLQFLMQRANARAQKRVEATTKKRKAVAALLESPTAKRKNAMGTPVGCESPRSKLLQKLAEDLASLNFQISFGAIWSCSTEKVNSAEAKEHCLDSKLQKLLARNSCLLVKMAV